MRSETDVFSDLAALCRSDGYVHALAYLCFRDSIVCYSGEMRPKDMRPIFSEDRLIRTEISILIGLMIQGDMNWSMPSPDVVEGQLERTESLLKELHQTFLPAMGTIFTQQAAAPDPHLDLLGSGEFMREAIFYGGESAYSFQYRDFAPQKYAADAEWLQTNKGFTISEGRDVTYAIARLQEQKLMATVRQMETLRPEHRSILPGYTFSVSEVAGTCSLPQATIEAVLDTFALAPGERNELFCAVDDFNVANATPLLRLNDGFVLFQAYSLAEALYESPFYWMVVNRPYASEAMRNRGRFTEAFCRDRLELVFGKERVYTNVDIFESTAKKVGEIDVLVLFGDRAMIVQAKSKRLTIESRKGNSGRIREDFKKSVQESYDQGLICAQKLTDAQFSLVCPDGQKVNVPRLTEIYFLCVVSDHYPSLHSQARQFLKYERTGILQPPLVVDVFALDAITEMLPSPLRFSAMSNAVQAIQNG